MTRSRWFKQCCARPTLRGMGTHGISSASGLYIVYTCRYVVWSVRGSGNLAIYLLYSSNSMSLKFSNFLKKNTIKIFFDFK